MSPTLTISPNLALPLEAVTQTFAILAKRGVGKTYTSSVMVEELLKANLPVVVVDPIGVWWGLRASADGKGPGLPIAILGGDHGDVPLEETAGQVIADLVVDERLSLVLDLSLFRKAQQTRFMTDFAERLYHRNRQPLHLVLDEADAFAPQRPMKGQERLLGAIEDLVRRGRARGLGVTLVTQRAAVLNKDVLTQCEVLVCLRTIAPQDRDAVDAWIRVHGTPEQREEMMSSLPSLPIGAAWFWSPGWLDVFQRVKVRRRETFDSSATPKMGEILETPRRLADINLDVLRERIADTIEKAKADDPKELRRRIAELERQLKARPAEARVETVTERVEVPVIDRADLDRLEAAVQQIADVNGQGLSMAQSILSAISSARAPLKRVERPATTPRPVQRREPPASTGDTSLVAGERKMLEVLARRFPGTITKTQLGTLSRYTPSGGTFSKYYSNLKRQGLLEEMGRDVIISEQGLARAGVVPADPQTPEEIRDMWRGTLVAGERALLDALIEEYPRSIPRDELGEITGYTASGGTFGKYLGTLRRNGLVEVEGQEVRASDTLFLGAEYQAGNG